MKRFATVRESRKRVEAFLPSNYEITQQVGDLLVIEGRDNAGWTMEDYLLPRLASGMIFARELTETAADEDPDIEWEGNYGFTVFGGALVKIVATQMDQFLVKADDGSALPMINRIPVEFRVWANVLPEDRLHWETVSIYRKDRWYEEATLSQKRKVYDFIKYRVYPFIPARVFHVAGQVAIEREISTVESRIRDAKNEIAELEEQKRELQIQLEGSLN